MDIAKEVSHQIIAPELKAKVFIDREDEQLFVTLRYNYGEISINPFSPQSEKHDKILIRDLEKKTALWT